MTGDGGMIVYVEDNDLNMKLMGEVLRIAGFDMVGSPDGDGLVDLVARARPLVVLLDIQLPKRSGIDLLGDLRRDARTAAIPAYAVTAFADSRTRGQLEKAGFDGVFTKPIDVRGLLGTFSEIRRPATGAS